MEGATILVKPSWIDTTIYLDIQWDPESLDSPPVTGKWWGDLAVFGGTGSNEGEWRWDPSTGILDLWVPIPGQNYGHLIAHLSDFDFNNIHGSSGDGRLSSGLVPTTEPAPFTWEVP